MTTRDEVIKAAKEAGFAEWSGTDDPSFLAVVERFYDIAYKAGMELAAEIADDVGDSDNGFGAARVIREEVKKMSRLCRLKSHQGIGDDGKWAYAEIIRLRALLDEAADDIEAWGAYASEYFQKRHNLAGTIAKYREAVQGVEQ